MSHRDWTSLPLEILQLISDNLQTNFTDLYRFRSVCKSFSQIQIKKPQNPPPQLPWLLLPSLHNNRPRFYSISDERIYHLPPSQSFNKTTICHRSSFGWLLMIEEDTLNTSLLNPLTEVRVSLPSVRMYDHVQPHQIKFIGKTVLSGNPNLLDDNEEVIVVILCGRVLMYAKLGDDAWKHIRNMDRCLIEDVIYFKGKPYAVDSKGQVGICDFGGSDWSAIQRIDIDIPNTFHADDVYRVLTMNYLVESSGELLLVRRFQEEKLHRTVMFKVFKEDTVCKSWEEVKSLRGHALFLGYNQSFSLLASNYFGCKANCIYFTDNIYSKRYLEMSEPLDVGIFNLESGTIEQLPGYWCDHQYLAQPAVFVTPSPW